MPTPTKPQSGSVRLVEVGPRDGLQNEKVTLDAATRIELINRLSAAGVTHIEAGSFVSPKWVPQMAGSSEVFEGLFRSSADSNSDQTAGTVYSALTPNLRGFEAAIAAGAQEVAVFAAASEAFSQKNINCSIAESLERFAPVLQQAGAAGIPVRGYISCIVNCPYAGSIEPGAVRDLTEQLLAMGCYEVSLGDTTGVGTPGDIRRLLDRVIPAVGAKVLALHCHDTYGQAIANISAALDYDLRVFDSSIAGLGGCPYSPGASGNVATEDVVYLLRGLGFETRIDLATLVDAGDFVCRALGRATRSRVAQALANH